MCLSIGRKPCSTCLHNIRCRNRKPGEFLKYWIIAKQPKKQAESVLSYLSCRLTRLLILLHKPSQDTTRKVYTFVPTQKWTSIWTDEALYAKYGISESEVAFIEKVVRPMNLSGESEDE